MIQRFSLLLVLAGIFFYSAGQCFSAEEGRGWGSSWTTPHSEAERISREISSRLNKAMRAEDWGAAEKALDDAQRAGLESERLQALRAFVAIARHRYAEAVASCDRGLGLPSVKNEPATGAELFALRAYAHTFSGDDRSARADLERAIALDRKNLLVRNNYAWLLATSADATVRDGKRAIKFAREPIQGSDKTNPIFLDTLAAAEAEAGNFTAAINDEKRAIALVNGDRVIYERHLQNYLNKTPCRESNESHQAEFKLHVTRKQ